MGSGKTTVGRRLAKRLGIKFIDSDREIEKAADCSVADIFDLHGEAAFRDAEERVIKRLLDGPRHVLATGGGAFMSEATRDVISERATSIWLRADIETLLNRVGRGARRPLLQKGEPREVLIGQMSVRDPIYKSADVTVDSGSGSTDEVVEAIVTKLETSDAHK